MARKVRITTLERFLPYYSVLVYLKKILFCCRPDLLIRAARHYEGAMQILVRHAVMTAREVRGGRDGGRER